MTCEETRQTLSLYIDDCVSLPARVAMDEHLNRCPVCRAEVAALRTLTRRLSLMTRPTPPENLVGAITDALAIEAAARRQSPKIPLSRRIARFLEPRLMPYTIGSFASVIMFMLMFVGLRPHFVALREAALQHTVVIDITPESLAGERAGFGDQSPTLDPRGSLAALTRAYAHPHSDDHSDADDMIVVTDVFSNGAASLAEVVNPPRDKRMLDEFESALRQDAAFVRASLDGRPDTMRVVFAVQKVDKVQADHHNR
ncbi:MAG TPA: zf-HC2 domain-containing protein [Pyrinomonadaceae bacterium]|nr:zf-HC2 domain-containing protein [Pyrinomonadaceae bacterium]